MSTPYEDFVSPFVCRDCREVVSVFENRTPLACGKCGSLNVSPLQAPERPSDYDVVQRIFENAAYRAQLGEDLPYESIVATPTTARVPPSPEGRRLISYMLAFMLASSVSENDTKAAFSYMDRLEEEFQILFSVLALRRNDQLAFKTEFGEWRSTKPIEDWSSQIGRAGRRLDDDVAKLRRTLEEQISLSAGDQPKRCGDQSKSGDGGKCPRCGAMTFYLEPPSMYFD